MKKLSPIEECQHRAAEYKKEFEALQGRYATYHYKNTCSSMGLGPTKVEFLTGDRTKVNCPWCKRYLERVATRAMKIKAAQ